MCAISFILLYSLIDFSECFDGTVYIGTSSVGNLTEEAYSVFNRYECVLGVKEGSDLYKQNDEKFCAQGKTKRPYLLKRNDARNLFKVEILSEWTEEVSVRNLEGTLHWALNHCPRAIPDVLSDGTKMTTSVLWKVPNMGSKTGIGPHVLYFLHSTKVVKHSDLERRNVTGAAAKAAAKA